ncbi:MAG: hypothetical protein VKO44_00630 [Cyanobacteriota bacterium]|nr:hypothetical protein [Cyanobacteriota bacterium]
MDALPQLRAALMAPGFWRKLPSLVLLAVGWLLSPLCWWNDLLINLPIAIGFGKLVSLLNPGWLLPGAVVGYWLSNLAGVLLMRNGTVGLLAKESEPQSGSRDLLWGLMTSSLYTAAIALAMKLGWLALPPFETLIT